VIPALRWPDGRPDPDGQRSERGTGVISSLVGITMFLGFLFFAVQLLFNLYATSVVTANSFDAARRVAAAPTAPGGSAPTTVAAEREARDRMGEYGSRVRFDWSGTDADTVRLHIRATNPRLLLFAPSTMAFDRIDRTIVVRRERFR